MVKYDYQKSIRMNSDVKDSLERICEVHKIKESDFIRLSLEEKLLKEMNKVDIKPSFSTLYYQTV
tara:strand:+ start:388 stop:582 length:195 start_codon:yes stop_codon:yes gene_type:complete